MITSPPAPFSCNYSPNLPELLWTLQCSVAISTFQAGKVIVFSATGPDSLIQLPRDFRKAMGLAINDRRLAVATQNEVVILADAAGLAGNYSPQTPYDALYLPRAVYYTGEVDIHDMEWGDEGLYAVNTRFSCLSLIDDHYSFRPWWRPSFIPDFGPFDFCHLNGMALESGKPRYVTLLGKSTSEKGWRNGLLSGGMVMDVSTGETVLAGLPMPHSPRLYDGYLYLLLSATGELIRIDLSRGTYDVVTRVEGFVRGLARIGDYLAIGISKLRQNTSTFRELPIADKAVASGLAFIHLPTGNTVAQIHYQASVEEIYDVKIIPARRRPGILNHETTEHRRALNTPDFDFWSA
ncbi:MAG: TIGR03032 family protein [Saprospiraceae bacterium]|nr:TIGR03032 family protein [Saprospiraceae bacterium]